jgi:hypothetical protein
LQRLVDLFSAQGITVALPPNGVPDELYSQRLIDTARTRGIATNTAEFQAALTAFRTGNTLRAAVSDSAGRFVIRDVPPGTYTVTAEREGYFGGTVNNASNTAATSTAVVTAGGNASVSISMIAGATISGRVVIDGAPQVGANVQAFSITYQNGYQVLQQAVSRTTDDRGEYRLFFLPPGEYLVAASPRQVGRPSIVTAGAASVPSPSQLVRTFYPGTADSASALALRTRGSEEIPGIDIAIRTEKTYKVSGKVVNYVPLNALRDQAIPLGRGGAISTPIITSDVGFALHDPEVPDDMGGRTIGAIQLRPSGNALSADFEVTGVLPGSYDWRASVQEVPADGVLQPSTAIIPIEVRGSDVTGLVLEIYQTVPVTGTVTIDGSAPARSPVRVWLQVEGASAKRPGYQQIASRVVQADAQTGSFTIPGIQIGRFHLMLGNGLSPDLYIEDVRQSGQSVFDAGFVMTRDTPAPLQVSLRSGAGTVEGTVLDASKKPVGGASIALIPPASSRQNRARYQTATSDATGRFFIRNVIPGDYKIFAWPDVDGGAYFNARFLSRYEERGRSIHVGQGSTTRIEIPALLADGN